MKKHLFFSLLFLSLFFSAKAQHIHALKEKIQHVIEGKSATVAVSICGTHPQDTLSIHGNKALPMQSVFKFHIAFVLLQQVDAGKINIDTTLTIEKATIEKYKHLWSPLCKKYPQGGRIALKEVITQTVAWSDNFGCDLLLDLLGGTVAVEAYLHEIGIKDIAMPHKEITMQAQWENQYENWTTTNAANQMLQLFHENQQPKLSKSSYDFLLKALKDTQTGKKRIRGMLPADAEVAHKTGTSGKNDAGLVAATNNIGIVFLPGGAYFYISVFVSNSTESGATNEKIIAEIAKLAWDFFAESE